MFSLHPFQNSFIYKPCQSDAASLPDTSCHSSDFIGFTQLRDLSVGRDVQTTEKMRLRNGTIFIDMLSLLLTCALASVLSFLLSSQSRVTPPSLSLVFLFFPFYSSAPDGLSALGEPIAKSAQGKRGVRASSWPSSEAARALSLGLGPLWRSRATEGAVSVIRRHRRRGSRTTWCLWSARIFSPHLLRRWTTPKLSQIGLGHGRPPPPSPPPAPCPIATHALVL